jgi:hypothetical protein
LFFLTIVTIFDMSTFNRSTMKNGKLNIILLDIRLLGILSLFFLLNFSCNNDTSIEEPGCGCSGPTIEVIENEEGVIVFDYGEFLIKRPNGKYLVPCDGSVYADSLHIDGLELIYSCDLVSTCPNMSSWSQFAWFKDIKKKQ